MKFFIALILLSLNLQFAKAQKQGNIWMGGGNGGINFNSDTTVSFFRPDNSIFGRTSASICDTNGNLLFYTNGFRIFNSSYSVIQNGDSLNIGDYISFNYGYMVTPDGAVIIPVPGETTKYYLFYMDLNFINTEMGLAFFPTHLFYSLIDNSLDGGSGGIVAGMKDISIINDTLAQFGMQAMKHGNGRDWWLICHEYGTNAYYTFLIDVLVFMGQWYKK
ncbi:MAG: hypothetical protein IPG39_03540 [Bacteroidetes bacterium]|nr:hypothetical protein [Bacteroidota bacterium]